jgi:TrmH family RNA methyltransferase
MLCKEISSLQHPLVKHLVKLRQSREYRYQKRRILLSGSKLIQELSSPFPIRVLVLEKGTAFPAKADQLFYAPIEILKKITGQQNPEPLAAELDMPPSCDLSCANFLLILDGVSDPGNLGTLLRTARALGWDGAFLTPGSTDPFNEKALCAAKGATLTLPWKSGTWKELALLLKKRKMTLLAADVSGQELTTLSASPPLALALGNEAHGLTEEIKKTAQLVAIPMKGRIESLNVSAAGAILMHELAVKGTSMLQSEYGA